ncbi:hypothetical protein ACOJUR_13995 [Alicyclobacillus tolerans]|uniref:hypothetical protein n=1 Tax=Alicyclobacillus tolerans TaxID=90970 RepID=UPI003B787C34
MQKRIWGLTASMLALTCLTVTGCGTVPANNSSQQNHFSTFGHKHQSKKLSSDTSNSSLRVNKTSNSTLNNHSISLNQNNISTNIRKVSSNERFQSIIQEAMSHITEPKFPLMAPTLPEYRPSKNLSGFQPFKDSTSMFLGATTESNLHSYMVNLQWAHSQLPVNSPNLSMPPNTGDATIIGSFGGKQYSSSKAALEQLDIQQINSRLLPPANSKSGRINLGEGIQGMEYSISSGKVSWVIWHQNDWQLEVMGGFTLPSISVAKEVATYLHKYNLPSKNGVFIVQMAADGNHTSALWVNGNVRYFCSDYHSALQAAKMLVSMRLYP